MAPENAGESRATPGVRPRALPGLAAAAQRRGWNRADTPHVEVEPRSSFHFVDPKLFRNYDGRLNMNKLVLRFVFKGQNFNQYFCNLKLAQKNQPKFLFQMFRKKYKIVFWTMPIMVNFMYICTVACSHGDIWWTKRKSNSFKKFAQTKMFEHSTAILF
jgi:hypothetical protein